MYDNPRRYHQQYYIIHTLHGSEILRSPVEVGSLSHYLRWVLYIPGGWEWDFWSIHAGSIALGAARAPQCPKHRSLWANELPWDHGKPVRLPVEIQKKTYVSNFWLVVEPTHLKNMIVKMGSSSPSFGMKIRNVLNHHPDFHRIHGTGILPYHTITIAVLLLSLIRSTASVEVYLPIHLPSKPTRCL